jgi:hypothetical protein
VFLNLGGRSFENEMTVKEKSFSVRISVSLYTISYTKLFYLPQTTWSIKGIITRFSLELRVEVIIFDSSRKSSTLAQKGKRYKEARILSTEHTQLSHNLLRTDIDKVVSNAH